MPEPFLLEDGYLATKENEIVVLLPLLEDLERSVEIMTEQGGLQLVTTLRTGQPCLILPSVRFTKISAPFLPVLLPISSIEQGIVRKG